MKSKELGKKLLSGALALGLCVTMAPIMPAAEANAAEAESGDQAPAAKAESGTPELKATSDTWNGTDDIRVYVDNCAAIADRGKLVIAEGGDKYELVDGHLKLKDGQKAEDGDQIKIQTEVSYYTGDQVLWSDGLEEEGTLTPDSSYYGLAHSDAMSYTGLKAATPAPKDNSQNGLFSPAINSEGSLVFWYYDPATADETDPSKWGDDADQAKFGMMINSYQALFLGVGIPSESEATDAGMDDHRDYADTYTVREAGIWYPTNIKRTEGWHKMQVDVSSTGAVMSIDGAKVCKEGSEEQLVVTDVKTIEKVIVAANWGTKAETQEYINDKHFIDDIYVLARGAGAAQTLDLDTTITVETGDDTEEGLSLVFGEDNTGVLAKGENGRVYLEGADDLAIESVEYTTNNENIEVSEDGTLSYKAGYAPEAGDTVQVTAKVTYYDQDGVVFTDSFEGEKKFTDGDSADLYKHSTAGSLYGRQAATANTTSTGSPSVNLDEVSDVTVTAWYYDANGGADQTKFGFGINENDNAALGIFYDGSIAALVDDMTKTHYAARVKGFTYENYGFGTTDVERSTGWHKFEWVIDSEKGLTEKIDGKVISTNTIVGTDKTDMDLVKVENNENIKSLNRLAIRENWNNNATNMAEIQDRHFIDGVTVVENGTGTVSETVTSVEIPLQDVQYTVNPTALTVDSTYPDDQTVYINPYVEDDTDTAKVLIDDKEVDTTLWTAGMGEAPENALNYPDEMLGYRVIVDGEAFEGLSDGEHVMTIVTAAGSEITVNVTAAANTHVPTDYYLSNKGDDSNDGHSPETAWASFDKLQSVTFGPGDHIYLDAESTWNGVQFRPEGSGAEGAPIVLTKYNDGGDSSKRPILNGNGTVADLEAHSYLAFDAWRKFYPSGTIELINVEQWEIRGIEVTNYAQEMQKGAVGRNGIAIIYDYYEVQGLTELPASNAEKEEAFYRAGKAQHFVVDDCYVHDVTGYHPTNGAVGAGGKMSGGINAYGPMDDLHMDNNIVMYCDVEGIRNDVLAWMGDTRTQFPAYMEDITANNNYIAGVPGDGVVISSANQPEIANNYLTDAGYSYYAPDDQKHTVSGWSTGDLASCRDVEAKTGLTVKEMGNRQNPTTMGSTNFAGLWFIGTKDAVAQYNEAVNNVWVCNDSEAFDADMFCWGTIFQYNYTYRNNGGFALFMGTMDEGTVVRYNISVEDAQSIGISESQNGLFHYNGTPEAIYNNLFVLGDKLATIFGGESNTAYFYNNIVIAPNGLTEDTQFKGFHINGSSDGDIKNPPLSGEMTNNIFYPAEIIDSVVDGSTVKLEDNIVLESEDEMYALFEDLEGFMDAQPVKALLGRSDFDGDITVEELEGGKGAGVAFSSDAGRSIQTPTGGFDLTQFEGVKLADDSVAIGAGKVVDREYDYKEQNDAVNPLKVDFFGNDISEQETVDIGPFQYSYADEDVKPADKTELKAYLDKLAIEGVDTAKYTTSTVEKYEEALKAAENVMDDDTLTAEDQQKIADTLAALKAAVEGLKEKADTSALKAYMDELKADEELADLTKYTEDTVAAYQAALADAENTAENQNLSVDEQSVVDNVLAALKTARTNLTLKDDGSETPSDVNKEELKDYVDDLAGQKLDLSKYSSDTVAAYQAALKHAQDILGSADASQADVDQALADLKAAYDSMIKTADKGSGDSADKDNTDKGSADKNGGAVQTGDSTPVILWAVILIAAAGAVTGVVVVRRRKSGK